MVSDPPLDSASSDTGSVMVAVPPKVDAEAEGADMAAYSDHEPATIMIPAPARIPTISRRPNVPICRLRRLRIVLTHLSHCLMFCRLVPLQSDPMSGTPRAVM
jgi:hypothetical protein